MTVVTSQERLFFFPYGDLSLSGILSVPAEPNGLCVLIPWGGGAFPSSGRNRLRARLARAVADRGFYAFRFDYCGVAESDGEYVAADMAKPNTEEIVAASRFLAGQGLSRIVVVSNCFGAWSSLMAAPLIEGLEGIAAVNPPVRRDHSEVQAADSSWKWWKKKLKRMTWSKLADPAHRTRYRRLVAAKANSLLKTDRRDSRFVKAVEYLIDHRVSVLLMYGVDGFRADAETDLDGGLRARLDRADSTTRLVLVDEQLRGCMNLAAQDALLREVLPWLDEIANKHG